MWQHACLSVCLYFMYNAHFIPPWAYHANKFTLQVFIANMVRKSSTKTKRRMTWRCNVLRGRPSIWTVWRTRTLGRTCRPARYTSYTPQRIRLKLTVDTMTPAVTRSKKTSVCHSAPTRPSHAKATGLAIAGGTGDLTGH